MALNISTKLSTETVFFQPLIEDIRKGQIKIPKFQRPYVWKEAQAIRLLDSVARSYPIGSLLIWRTPTKMKTERTFGNFTLPETPNLMPTDYVLDGQQRLTVIYSCLGPKPGEGGFEAIFDLEAEEFKPAGEVTPALTLFPLRKLFVTTDLLDFRTALQAHSNHKQLQERLDQLIAAFTQYKIPVVYLKDLELDEVCPIFERVNSSGTKLSTYDLMVAATWSEEFDLDDKIATIADALEPKGFEDIDRITVVKCMSALHSGSIKDDAVKNLRGISAEALNQLTENTRQALYRTVDALSTEFGVYSWDFLSYEALVVVMCVLYSKHSTLTADQHRRLRQWFWRASWSERYKAGGETFVSNDIERVIKFVIESEGDVAIFGEAPTEAEWRRTYFRINAARSRALALALAKMGPLCILNGAKIDVQEALSAFNKKQFHHVYPRAHLKRVNAEDDNLVLNICLLPASANLKISDQDPTQYLPKLRDDLGEHADSVFASNLLPMPSEFSYDKATYEEFLAARLKLMRSLVSKLCDGG
ncbi:DUF262 domain-containing protein [Burkholderia sp. MSMB1589WGS]|uniref:GmrSD restriction endonuclease domain-containing protein n=1 Tax=Burkholderia sp. MSMB1589WGS TaxID=1636425 RepID=UPI000ADB460E|nr:DUF262 domain-containing protein [Burkholderia sp. MSMB1589WGS]